MNGETMERLCTDILYCKEMVDNCEALLRLWAQNEWTDEERSKLDTLLRWFTLQGVSLNESSVNFALIHAQDNYVRLRKEEADAASEQTYGDMVSGRLPMGKVKGQALPAIFP